jgi:glycine hydroxymethyltransferase|tara:strand:+ start:4297 stop:5457 length:1161 start_codon:yes stop_codon:yes gene_type:complete
MLDDRINKIYQKELSRQKLTVELIASENFASKAVMKMCGSEFTNKYAEGYPGARYYNGCEFMDEVEQLAIDQLKEIYGCEFANVQPHSGANANLAVMKAFLNVGDTILGMDLASGGHLTHGAPVTISGKWFDAHTFGVGDDGLINYDDVQLLAEAHKPKMIIAGASAYPRQIDWKRFREIADSVGALLMVDMAHYSGLIAGGVYDDPLPYADVVTSTTHKTLRGPRGGIILWNNPEYTRRINGAIFPGTQGGPLMNTIAAKAQAFVEANTPEFKHYASQVVLNAKAFAETLNKSETLDVLTGGTDSHIILISLVKSKLSGREAADILEKHRITVNKNGIPNDPRNFKETSGIRLGTAAETTRGFKVQDFIDLGERIINILEDPSQW